MKKRRIRKENRRLESYLKESLSRYQDILEERNMESSEAPDGIEYRNPGIIESQISTILSERFKSGRLSFSKIETTFLAKTCASKFENKWTIELEELKQLIDLENEKFLLNLLQFLTKNLCYQIPKNDLTKI